MPKEFNELFDYKNNQIKEKPIDLPYGISMVANILDQLYLNCTEKMKMNPEWVVQEFNKYGYYQKCLAKNIQD